GGMKGRKKEMIRAEVHADLRRAFPASAIDSEYGMTELMSQAYMKDSGAFVAPDWMRVYTRDIADPLSSPQQNGSRGALNVIDLANVDSCAFLALADQGQVFENGTFEVYGRLDHSEIRGCNLMISL
ncbi:MAG: acyl transferase, partial [Schleiferiaceae bacterium]